MKYIQLQTEITNHWLWKDPEKLKWWLDILMNVKWSDEPSFFMGIECKKHQVIYSLETWAQRWRVDRGRVRRFFEALQNEHIIRTENVQKTTRLTLCHSRLYDMTCTVNARSMHGKRTVNAHNSIQDIQYTQDKQDIDIAAPQPQSQTLPLVSEIDEQFAKFKEWMQKNAPEVLKMKKPITVQQYAQLRKDYPTKEEKALLQEKLTYMDNRPDLHKKYSSAYATLTNWMKKDVEELRKKPAEGATVVQMLSPRELMDQEIMRQTELNYQKQK